MTTLRCPECGTPLAGGGSCAVCGLPLGGEAGARLWLVDQRLEALESELAALRAERAPLLVAMRSGSLPPRGPGGRPVVTATGAPAPSPPAPPPPRQEWTPERVQNALLTLGALLLGVAAAVFLAVSYRRVGIAGRAAVLTGLTAVSGAAPLVLLRRDLRATAESLAGVAVALVVLDLAAARRLGLLGLDGPDLGRFVTTAGLVVAVAAGVYASALRLRVPAVAGVLALQVAGAAEALQGGGGRAGVVLALLAAVDGALALLLGVRASDGRRHLPLRRLGPTAARTAAGSSLVAWGVGLLAAVSAAEGDRQVDEAVLALVLLAAVAVAASAGAREATARTALSATATVTAAGAAVTAVRDGLTAVQRPVVVVACALLAVLAGAALPRLLRPGPVLGSGVLTAAALAAVAEDVATAATGPLGWALDLWSADAGGSARRLLSPSTDWDGTVAALVVLTAAAAVAGLTGALLDRPRPAAAAAAAALVLAGVVLPLGLGVGYRGAVASDLLLGAAGLAAAVGLRRHATLAWLAGSLLLLHAVAWSLADRDTTLAVLPLAAVLLTATALAGAPLRTPATAAVVLLVGGEVVAVAAARGADPDQAGAALALVPAVVVGLLHAVDRTRGRGGAPGAVDRSSAPPRTTGPVAAGPADGAEVAAGVLLGVALVLATADPGWLSWVLAGAGLVALADAVRPGRLLLAYAGALLLAAASWVRLAEADVTAPEPYAVPVSLVALGLGHLRRRRTPDTGSLAAYGPGLTGALVPSLVAALADDGLLRPLLLGATAVVVVVVGARARLAAPLVVGGAVLVADALRQLAPLASTLPRWVSLAAAGALLVGLGATWEQRRRDLDRLRRGLASLG